ncbi:Aste57867_14782 [Aphanomyces stellatus]|uniref:Aste57867_14782 protein n=1 Tax=Aphanomyces stellatus TaxID=120398 RepID=A0A485L248_9STRA|nr:hypothetical protein As57867_014727 [Aphanomyces stellatus]VFT91600.1 Aste57867_14782 [Aphanomyces stellatus]
MALFGFLARPFCRKSNKTPPAAIAPLTRPTATTTTTTLKAAAPVPPKQQEPRRAQQPAFQAVSIQEPMNDALSAEDMRKLLAELEKNWVRNNPQAFLARAWDCMSVCSTESTFSCMPDVGNWIEETNDELLYTLKRAASVIREPRQEAWV